MEGERGKKQPALYIKVACKNEKRCQKAGKIKKTPPGYRSAILGVYGM